MICISVHAASTADLVRRVTPLPFAEVRLDGLSPSDEELVALFGGGALRIATVHADGRSANDRAALLVAALRAGASHVDVDLLAEEPPAATVIGAARERGAEVIVSFHDYEGTPSSDRLAAIVDACFARGADMAKVACRVRGARDAARLIGLLDDDRRIIAVGMGPGGRITRLAGALLRSPVAYAARAPGEETAGGQIPASRLAALVEELCRD